MTADIQPQPIELVTINEAARRLRACSNTLKRRITRAGILPDAFLLEGSSQMRSPLFVSGRLQELRRLISNP